MQYDVISAGAQKAIANYKSDIKQWKSHWTAESFKKRYYVDINDELAWKTIAAMNYVMMLGGKDWGSDGFNAYIIFAGIIGKEANWRTSNRAEEAICHKLGVNCKVADYPKANLTWTYVQLSDGNWYHFDGYFKKDPEQVVEGGSACTIFY